MNCDAILYIISKEDKHVFLWVTDSENTLQQMPPIYCSRLTYFTNTLYGINKRKSLMAEWLEQASQ